MNIKLPPGIKLPRALRRPARVGRCSDNSDPPVAKLEMVVYKSTLPPMPVPVEATEFEEGDNSTALDCELLPALPVVPDTLESFTREAERRFPWLKAKLTITIKKTGQPDTQQWQAACRLAWEIGHNKQNVQVIAPTGQGKTYVIGGKILLLASFWPDRFDPSLAIASGRMPPLIIQPAKGVMQCRLVLMKEFGISNVIITTLAALRSSLGENLLEFKTVIVNGQPVLYPYFFMERAPVSIDMDESQMLKNESTQTDIIVSAANHGIPVVTYSATPYSRPCQARAIAEIIQPVIGGSKDHPIRLNTKLWPSFVKECCPPRSAPTDWTPQGLRKVQQYLEPYTIRWAIPYPYAVKTKLVSCKFINEASRQRYMDAFEAWQEVRAQHAKSPLVGMAAVLVAIQKFNQVAEEERVDPLVRYVLDFWLEQRKKGCPYNVILAFAYRTSADIALARLESILGKADFKRHVAVIVGGIDSSADHAAFQADCKTILVMTISCGGAALSLDHNHLNKNPRRKFASGTWNDIQVVQFAGRTQRLMTQSMTWLYFFYFAGTEEAKKMRKVLRKIACLKEITTNNHSHDSGESSTGTFVQDIEDIEHVDGAQMITAGALPANEDEEDIAANEIIGTTQRVDIEFEDDEEDE